MRSEFSVTEVSVSWEIISAQIHRCIRTTFLFYRKIRAHFAPSVDDGWEALSSSAAAWPPLRAVAGD